MMGCKENDMYLYMHETRSRDLSTGFALSKKTMLPLAIFAEDFHGTLMYNRQTI